MSGHKKSYKVFISSTYIDNAERRKIVEDAVIRANMQPIGMERFAASAHPTVVECERYARDCDIYVGIIAQRYGWIPDGKQVSITELEYDAAKEAQRPRLMFEIDESVPVDKQKDFDPLPDRWDKQKKLDDFKAKYRKDQMPTPFTDTSLGTKVLHALNLWRDQHESKQPAAGSRKPDDGAVSQELDRYRAVESPHETSPLGLVIAILVIVLGFALAFFTAPGASGSAGAIIGAIVIVVGLFACALALREPAVNVDAIMKALGALYETQLAKEIEHWKGQARTAVVALAQQLGRPDAPTGIEQALQRLAQGDTEAAERFFEQRLNRKRAEGDSKRAKGIPSYLEVHREAAEAARHLAVLHLLRDKDKALEDYRISVDLDPENIEGWTWLGKILLYGDDLNALDEAEEAFVKVLRLLRSKDDKRGIANTYEHLERVYEKRASLRRAEGQPQQDADVDLKFGKLMGLKAKAALQAPGQAEGIIQGLRYPRKDSKEGKATKYKEAGDIFLVNNKFPAAAEAYDSARAISDATGDDAAMAMIRIDLAKACEMCQEQHQQDRAARMYREAREIFRKMGYSEQLTRRWLESQP